MHYLQLMSLGPTWRCRLMNAPKLFDGVEFRALSLSLSLSLSLCVSVCECVCVGVCVGVYGGCRRPVVVCVCIFFHVCS